MKIDLTHEELTHWSSKIMGVLTRLNQIENGEIYVQGTTTNKMDIIIEELQNLQTTFEGKSNLPSNTSNQLYPKIKVVDICKSCNGTSCSDCDEQGVQEISVPFDLFWENYILPRISSYFNDLL